MSKVGKDVFDLKGVEITKAFEGEIDNFIKSLENTKIQGLNIKGMIEFLAKENKVEQEVKETVIKRIGELE